MRRKGTGWKSRGGIFSLLALGTVIGVSTVASPAAANGPITWSLASPPNTVAITGGPWTLEQSGAANGLKSSGYCTSPDSGITGVQVGNPGTERMQPYYFPFIVGV